MMRAARWMGVVVAVGRAGGRGRLRRQEAPDGPAHPPATRHDGVGNSVGVHASARAARTRGRADDRAAEPVREDAIASASLDDINRNSPLKPLFFELRQQRHLDRGPRRARCQCRGSEDASPPGPSPSKATATSEARAEYNLALGERRAVAARALPGIARHLRRPAPHRELREGISLRCGARRDPRTRRTGARISSSPRSETAMRISTWRPPRRRRWRWPRGWRNRPRRATRSISRSRPTSGCCR